MGFVATIHVAHPDLVLARTIESNPDATFRYEYGSVASGTHRSFVSVFADEYERIERSMAADPTVSEPTRVATFENRAIYQVTIETDLDLVPEQCTDRGLFVFGITSDAGEWAARVHLPDRDTLADFRDYCRKDDISFRVTELYDSTATDDRTYFLTDQQHEILSMAYYAGYYDIPREISQDDLADRLNISTSAVSQRLRRAVAELIEATIENDHTLNQ